MSKCILCQSSEFINIYKISDIEIIRCKNCRIVYRKDHSQIENKSLYEESYYTDNVSKKGKNYISSWQLLYDEKRYTEELKNIKKYIPTGDLLDVGTGIGNFLKYAKQFGYDPIGIEISKFASDYANNIGYKVINGTIEDIFQTSEKKLFDVITMHHFLEHTLDPIKTLHITFKLLKKEGLLVIEVPNFKSYRSKINRENWEDLRPIEHIYHFEPKTLSLLLKKSGFQILKIKTKGEVLWSLAEPLRLFMIPDRVILQLQKILKYNSFTNADSIKPNSTPRKLDYIKYFTHLTRYLLFPLSKFYELLRIEKRLIIFAKKDLTKK